LVSAFVSIPFFPIVGIEEPTYTIHAYNLAKSGMMINEYFKDCGYELGWTTLDKKISWPPLHSYMLSWFLKFFPYDLRFLRMTSAFAGGLFLLALIFFLKLFFDSSTSLFMLFLIGTNPLFRFISQEARPDIWVALSSLLVFLFLVKFLTNKNEIDVFIASVFASVAVLLHMFGVVVIGSFFVVLFFYSLKGEIQLKTLLFSSIISLTVLTPYLIDVYLNFFYFRIQLIDDVLLKHSKKVLFADQYSILLFSLFLFVGLLSFFLDKTKPKLVILRDTFLAVNLFLVIFSFRFRYTFVVMPLCVAIIVSLIQIRISRYKCLFLYIISIVASVVFTVSYILPMSQPEESYWEITEEIDLLIGKGAKVIGHPLIQWGLDPEKGVRISECTDATKLDLNNYDFVIVERYFQEIVAHWPPEIMARLDLVFDDPSRVYNFKVYRIKKTQNP